MACVQCTYAINIIQMENLVYNYSTTLKPEK